jgi:hypothetical protein
VDKPQGTGAAVPPSSGLIPLAELETPPDKPQGTGAAVPPSMKIELNDAQLNSEGFATQTPASGSITGQPQTTQQIRTVPTTGGLTVVIQSREVPPSAPQTTKSGNYYIQLGIYGNMDALQNEARKIDGSYPVQAQSTGIEGKSSYRLLVGPLNEGESNASLLHFKRYGFKDAFIRKN